MHYSDEDVLQFFEENGRIGKVESIACGDATIRVVKSGNNSSKSCIIFSHGAPGSWDAFKGFLVDARLLSEADLISYDRPGYGGSGTGQSYPEISFQAECLIELMDTSHYDSFYLVGHSFGGPIVMEAAMLDPLNIDGVVLIAPVVDPATEKYFIGGKLAYWPLTRWLWPQNFQVSADEKYKHVEELQNMESAMDSYQTSTLFIHSMDDWIAPAAGNIEFLGKMVPDTLLESRIYQDKGHLVLWTDHDMVVDLILEFIRG